MTREKSAPPPAERRVHWSGRLVGVVAATLVWLFLGMLISIALEWVGMLFWWADHKAVHGVLHARAQLDAELSYLAADFRSTLPGVSPAAIAADSATYLYSALFIWRDQDLAEWLLLRSAGTVVADYLLSALYQVQLYGVRLAIALLSIPAFIVIGLVAAIEGLVDRELRKAGADVEHALVYHFAKAWLVPTLTMTWVVYLSLPISIHPNWIFIPGALLFGYALRVAAANFKMTL